MSELEDITQIQDAYAVFLNRRTGETIRCADYANQLYQETAMQVQWLMIGGPSHGRTFWIKAGGRVCVPMESGGEEIYDGENYLNDGKLYRVGICRPTAAQRAEIPVLISSTGLAHIAGS